jgi:hypothetical protein
MKAKFVRLIGENDPDTGGHVEMAIYKHENGGLFAIDASFLDQVADEDDTEDCYIIPDPFGKIEDPNTLELYD